MVNANDASLVVCCVRGEERAVLLLSSLSAHTPVRVTYGASLADFRTPEHDKVAVIDLGDAFCPSAERTIRDLRSAGFEVIGCTRGSDAWPVAQRAEAFLGGV